MFDRIRDAAQRKNSTFINNNKQGIDTRSMVSPFLTPAGQLASDGKAEAATFLRKKGANVDEIAFGYACTAKSEKQHVKVLKYYDKYKADIHYIAMGYAYANNFEKVRLYREKGALDATILKNFASRGDFDNTIRNYVTNLQINPIIGIKAYALAGKHSQIEAWRNNYKISCADIAKAYKDAQADDRNIAIPLFYKAINLQKNQGAKFDNLGTQYLDERDKSPPFFTTAGKLAFAGEHAAVQLLLKFGANLDEVAFAYACAGNHEQVKALSQKVNLNSIAKGYAYGKYDDKVAEFIKNGASINSVAQGYALGGHHDQVEHYRSKHHASSSQIAFIYAQTGNNERVAEYLNNHEASRQFIAQGYAYVNNDAELRKYPQLVPVNQLAQVYARANNQAKVAECIRLGASVQEIALGYAQAGNHHMVNTYRLNYRAQIDDAIIAKAYAQGGYYQTAQELAQIHNCHPSVAQGYAISENHKIIADNYSDRAYTTAIVSGYMIAGNYPKIEEYRVKGWITTKEIVALYSKLNILDTAPHFYRAVDMLRSSNPVETDYYPNILNRKFAGCTNDNKSLSEKEQADADRVKACTINQAREAAFPNFTVAGRLAYQGLNDGKTGYDVQRDTAVEIFHSNGAKADDIAFGYACAGNHEKVMEYITTHKASVERVIQGYIYGSRAKEVNEKNKTYFTDLSSTIENLRTHGAGTYEIAKSYAEYALNETYIPPLYQALNRQLSSANSNDPKDLALIEIARNTETINTLDLVRFYRINDIINNAPREYKLINAIVSNNKTDPSKLDIDEQLISESTISGLNLTPEDKRIAASALILNGLLNKFAESRDKLIDALITSGLNTNEIAFIYAKAGNHQGVEKYRTKDEAGLEAAITGYVQGRHQDSIEQLRCYGATTEMIALVYQNGSSEPGKIPKLYQAINKLTAMSDIAEAMNMLKAIERLRKGTEDKLNPYWRKSSLKLNLIVESLIDMHITKDNLATTINDTTSNLYKALNMKRITFFGKNISDTAKTMLLIKGPNPN